MRRLAFAAALAVSFIANANAQLSTRANLVVQNVQVFCQGTQPIASLTLPVMAGDVGRPGLLYIGMHDPSLSSAAFFVNSAWTAYQGGLFPINSIVAGLSNTQLFVPLPPELAGGGWKLYVGYGALSAASENQVQMAINAIDAAKALNANAAVGAVDPNHYRRTLMQSDMTQAGKYGYVYTGVENNPYVCQPDTGGGGH
ncbi:hypothetical protein BJG93_34465 (plasmid) [Paraburkholderia sprentiae WSM5005]|uniref:Uncharacterized protein n=1 Tax=Paraburkholderia sprentiae WSM5005 TaxID=754502 RepID=A0ACA8AWW1_9BURK|nr:hypothetical protein [Paraburkholderia sprentiae]APA90223.1 hypothetical protein BJG93_34465 [Paraburkholderia sprentiae WSM5005]